MSAYIIDTLTLTWNYQKCYDVYTKSKSERGNKMLSQQFQVFLQVAEQGSFSKAAKLLFVTPAAIMKHINTLENQLGIKLLNRTNQGINLTAAGKSLYEDGKRLQSDAEKALSKALIAERSERITVRVGSSLHNPSRVLTNLWEPLSKEFPEYKFSIIPYEDKKEQIIQVISSLGERIDLLVGSFNSKRMQEHANYLILGNYHPCIAVPKEHKLAPKKILSLQDLHGNHLMMVKNGDTEFIDHFQDMLKMTHPQIIIDEADYYYDIDTFNICEQTGHLLLTLDIWADIHPSLITIPLEWDCKVTYGILYSKEPSDSVKKFIKIIESKQELN